MKSPFFIPLGRISLKRIIILNAILCVILFSLYSFGHKGVLVNTVQTISIQPTSVKVSHVIDCGSQSSLNILPVLDADKNGKIVEDEINKFTNELQEIMVKHESSYKAILDGKTVFVPFQRLAVQHDPKGKSTQVEMIFFKDNLTFSKGGHILELEREGFQMDIPVLMAMVGYSEAPQHGQSHPAHMVKMEIRIPGNFKIIESNLGFSPENSHSLVKGIFLTNQQPKLRLEFEVLSSELSSM